MFRCIEQILIQYFQRHELPGCYYKDSDFCFLDDLTGKLTSTCLSHESDHSHNLEGDYFDLVHTVERFTGYAGVSAHNVWRAIYEENCFGLSELNLLASSSKSNVPAPVTLPDTMVDPFGPDSSQEQCLEKRVYYKVISGLHASISTHLCHEWFNSTSGEWVMS
jgi:ERO1-like protein beta